MLFSCDLQGYLCNWVSPISWPSTWISCTSYLWTCLWHSLWLSWYHPNTPAYIVLLDLTSTGQSCCLLTFFILFHAFIIWLIRSTCLIYSTGKSISNFLTVITFEYRSYLFPQAPFLPTSKISDFLFLEEYLFHKARNFISV